MDNSGSRRGLTDLCLEFGRLLLSPGATLSRLAEWRLEWRHLGLFLVLAGLLRGLLESAYILLHAGHFLMTLTQPYALRAYLLTGSAFLVANVVTALVRWVAFAMVIYLVGRWLGGDGRLQPLLRVYALALGVYPLTILPDYAYLFWSLPAIQFHVSPAYSPVIGIGQVLVSIWLIGFGYLSCRRLHHLGRLDSLLCGLALELFSLGSLVIGALVFFNLPPVRSLDRDTMVVTATVAFTLLAGAAGIGAWRLGHRLEARA